MLDALWQGANLALARPQHINGAQKSVRHLQASSRLTDRTVKIHARAMGDTGRVKDGDLIQINPFPQPQWLLDRGFGKALVL